MKKSLFLIALTFLTGSISYAQMPQATPLEDKDVTRFIKTFMPMKAELEELGEEFDEAKDYNAMQALAANEEVQSIFKKYGWDDQWLGKFMSLAVAYSFVKMEKEIAALSEEERKQQEQYMDMYAAQMKSMVKESDIEKVRKRFDELDPIFLEEDEDN